MNFVGENSLMLKKKEKKIKINEKIMKKVFFFLVKKRFFMNKIFGKKVFGEKTLFIKKNSGGLNKIG